LKLADEHTISSFASRLAYSEEEHFMNRKLPIVRVKCSNGYIVLNLQEEPELRHYFTSFLKWQPFVSGPSNTHVINWEQWYLPNEETHEQSDEDEQKEEDKTEQGTSYIISPDCSVCDEEHYRQIHGTNTVYMMTGTMFGCFWRFLGEHNFDEDLESQQCYFNPSYDQDSRSRLNEMGELTPFQLTDFSSADNWDYSGVCAFNPRQSDFPIMSQTHDMCTVDFSGENEANMEMGYHLKPSIGIDGKHCVCVKPSKQRNFHVSTADLDDAALRTKQFSQQQQQEDYKQKLKEEFEKQDIMNIPREKITYLYQSNFEHGTYRIRESGIYIVMENIVFDFNAGDIWNDPLSTDSWWPRADQQQIYPGAGAYRDAYFLGFWAGITIETDNVILDLGGHSLAMSDAFYYQQRWFTTIALQSQYFLPGQGPGFFGATPSFASHVIIRNGILGQSSHHNIHGHYNHDVIVENIHCRDFETHGIQFNGFDGITLRNIEIGPSSTKVFLRGSFGHARNLLPRLQQIANAMEEDDEYFHLTPEDKKIKFDGRKKAMSMQDIHDEMKLQLESVFRFVMTGEEPEFVDGSDDDFDGRMTNKKWLKILETFYNPSGLPHGAGMYGIFLNTVGASVLTYNLQTSTYSNNAKLENINIHHLQHSMIEFIRMGVPNSGSIYLNALHGCLDARDLLSNIEDIDTDDYVPRYKGNVITDATIAMEYFSNNWDILQASLIWHDRLFPWAFGEDLTALNDFNIGCNGDAQVHAAKGLTGIRVDGVNGLSMKDITIKDVTEVTPPGTDLCGRYSSFERDCVGKCGGHIRQKEPMQVGFSGHNLQGICLNAAKNVKMGTTNIHNLQSLYGLTYGISIWPSVDIEFEDKVYISNLFAGAHYDEIVERDEAGEIVYDDKLDEENYPNRVPEVCAIRLVDEYFSGTSNKVYKSTVRFADGHNQNDVVISNLDGYKTCFVDRSSDNSQPRKYSMLGSWNGFDSDFQGIGKDGIFMQEMKALQDGNEGHFGNTRAWIHDGNVKTIVVGILVFVLIICAIFARRLCYKSVDGNTADKEEEMKRSKSMRLQVFDGRIYVLPQRRTCSNHESTPLLQ